MADCWPGNRPRTYRSTPQKLPEIALKHVDRLGTWAKLLPLRWAVWHSTGPRCGLQGRAATGWLSRRLRRQVRRTGQLARSALAATLAPVPPLVLLRYALAIPAWAPGDATP